MDGDFYVFGYGSLIWAPQFKHIHKRAACIRGFKRRFWQASPDHRGTPDKPGRVLTLVRATDTESVREDVAREKSLCEGKTVKRRGSRTFGVAFLVSSADREHVLSYLDDRESGGYSQAVVEVTFVSEPIPAVSALASEHKAKHPHISTQTRAEAMVYVATTANRNFLGHGDTATLATQIANARGKSGRNVDYLFSLHSSLCSLHMLGQSSSVSVDAAATAHYVDGDGKHSQERALSAAGATWAENGEDFEHVSALVVAVRKLLDADSVAIDGCSKISVGAVLT